MPHPLPDDVNNVTGLRWFLAAVPDDPAFTRAAWDIFTEMTNFWKWGKEGPVPNDSDKAAALWSEAVYETIEAYQMGFPQLIIDNIDDIETILQAILDRAEVEGCCDDGVYDIVTDPDGIIQPLPDDTGQDIEWDIGTPPGGESTWESATLERCAQAEKFADGLDGWILAVQAMHALPTLGILIVLSYFLAALAGIGLGVAVAGGAFGVVGAYTLFAELQALFELTPDYAAAQAELDDPDVIGDVVCAIITSDNAAAAESAIDAALTASAPNAAPMIALLPLRWIMGHIFNLDGDGSGFGGACRDCTPDPVALNIEFRRSGANSSQLQVDGVWTDLGFIGHPIYSNTDYLFRGDTGGAGAFEIWTDAGGGALANAQVTVLEANTDDWTRLNFLREGEGIIAQYDTITALPITHTASTLAYRVYTRTGEYIRVRIAEAP